jgi:16S rRNA (guanine527-N7)-methyltransferase
LPDPMAAVFSRFGIDVSRETIEKLSIYERLLLKWQKAINLVGPLTLEDRLIRHFIDSAQLIKYIPAPQEKRLADMGSGAGFPGLVLAMIGVGDVHLIESDVRKSTFLREVSRETGTLVTVHDIRIEDCRIENVDIVTARALAPLKDLLKHAASLATKGHLCDCLFLKGEQYQEEIEKSPQNKNMMIEILPSLTDNAARILKTNFTI